MNIGKNDLINLFDKKFKFIHYIFWIFKLIIIFFLNLKWTSHPLHSTNVSIKFHRDLTQSLSPRIVLRHIE